MVSHARNISRNNIGEHLSILPGKRGPSRQPRHTHIPSEETTILNQCVLAAEHQDLHTALPSVHCCNSFPVQLTYNGQRAISTRKKKLEGLTIFWFLSLFRFVQPRHISCLDQFDRANVLFVDARLVRGIFLHTTEGSDCARYRRIKASQKTTVER